MSTEKDNGYKRAQAYKLAKDASLLDSDGNPTDEYMHLISEVTGKDKMADMTPEEADRFLEALGKPVQAGQIQRVSWLEDPWSRVWTWIVVFVVITVCFFVIDYFVGKNRPSWRRQITWAPVATAVLIFNMASAAILRTFVKRHGRNSTGWTTAIIVFTPILAGISYLLTWPKNKPSNG